MFTLTTENKLALNLARGQNSTISVGADGSVKLFKSSDASGAVSIIRVMIRDDGDGGGL
jgi:hypothetical protein